MEPTWLILLGLSCLLASWILYRKRIYLAATDADAEVLLPWPEVTEFSPTSGVQRSRAKQSLIKGNINGSGEKIYHAPGKSPYYELTRIDVTRGERWFHTESEALQAGWRAPKVASPSVLFR